MADNTDEEYLNTPLDPQAEILPEEILASKDTEAITNQETENMEVPHHPDLHHKPKKWKEYFLEFLMIFLAVTLGFFAESLRENISNHEREISYMRSIVNDLSADTSEIRQLKLKQDFLLKQFDAALVISPQQLHNPALQDSFYHHYMYFYSFVSYFVAHSKTLSQLQNAGGLTVIKQQDVVDSLSELNVFYDFYLVSDNRVYNNLYEKTNDAGAKVINCPPFMRSMKLPVPSISNDLPVLINDDLLTIRELYNHIKMEKGSWSNALLNRKIIEYELSV
jgi:hypothetical protein